MIMDKIKCEICGKKYKRITNTHLLNSHSITMQNYKDLYPNAKIDAPALADKRVEHLKGKTYEEIYGKDKAKKMKSKKTKLLKEEWKTNPDKLLIKENKNKKEIENMLQRELSPPLIGRPRDRSNYNTSLCKNCGREFEYYTLDSDGIFCCKDCNTEYSRRNSSNYRIKAFAYYPEECDICKVNMEDVVKLIVHHKDENPLNNDINNLQILCNKCHNKIHKKKTLKYRNKFSLPAIERGVRDILHGLKVDLTDANFFDTPKRVSKAYREIFEGVLPESEEELKTQLSKTFPCESSQMILIKDILAWSMCPHHLLPVKYNITIAYIPNKCVLGASKLPRLACLLARRPVLQEQLTEDITDYLQKYANPLGAAAHVEGQHMCMQMRGIKTQSSMITQSLKGVFLEDSQAGSTARNELVQLMKL